MIFLINVLIRNDSWCRHREKHHKTNISGAALLQSPDNQNKKYQKPLSCGVWYFFILSIHICGYVLDIVSMVCWHYNRRYLKGPEIKRYSSVLARICRKGALKADSVLIVIRRNVTGYTPVCI